MATILIVDDEPAIRDLVDITLDLAGYKSISASNAHEALVSVIDKKPDLVLFTQGTCCSNKNSITPS